MWQYLSDKYFSSKESEYTDLKTNETSFSIDLTNVNTYSDDDDDDWVWLLIDEDYPPEYYLKQLNIFNETEYVKEDYKPSSIYLLNRIEE